MVYLIIEESKQFCKIGFAETPTKRLESLQVGNPHKLFLLRIIEGTEQLETKIHHKFIHLHKRGDWFLYMPEILDYFDNSELKVNNPVYYTKLTSKNNEYKIRNNIMMDNDWIIDKLELPAIKKAICEQIGIVRKVTAYKTQEKILDDLIKKGILVETKLGKFSTITKKE